LIFFEAIIATIHPKYEAGIGNQNSHSGFFIFYIRNFPMTSFFRQVTIAIVTIVNQVG
jgi:hypothetical protein